MKNFGFLFILFFLSCTYYKVNNPPVSTQSIKQQYDNKKFLILHEGNNAWQLTNLTIHEESKTIQGQLNILPNELRNYLKPQKKSYNHYSEADGNPTIEVHLYVKDLVIAADNKVEIPISSIERMNVYDRDVEANTFSIILGSIAGVLAAGAVVFVVALATKSSCPFVYVRDGDNISFVGEIYSGAIYPSIERDDYLQLPDGFSSSSQPEVIISNELKEIQYTNLAELIHVEHPQNTKVILDQKGNAQVLKEEITPTFAKNNQGVNYLPNISKKDDLLFMFDSSDESEPDKSSLELRFKKPASTKSAKLVLTAKNSYWLDYTYGKFNELFGSYYNTFAKQQKKVSASELQDWSKAQSLPLQVSMWNGREWETIEYVNVVGPLAQRDIVIPIDLKNIADETIKVKLSCGFLFWELDYAAIDFGENNNINITIESPFSAKDKIGRDISKALKAKDAEYHVQPEIGNKAFLKFQPKIPKENNKVTTFLHSSGYYEYIREYKGLPNVLKLNEFKEKGAMSRFSKELMQELGSKPEITYSAYNNN